MSTFFFRQEFGHKLRACYIENNTIGGTKKLEIVRQLSEISFPAWTSK